MYVPLIQTIGRFVTKKSAPLIASTLAPALSAVSIRKRVALQNMEIAFPESTFQWRVKNYKACCASLVWTTLECLALERNPKQALEWMRVEGGHILEKALRDKTGLVLATAHISNWELGAAWMAQAGYPVHAIIRPPDNPEEAGYIEHFRTSMGVGTISKDAPMTRIISLLRRGAFMGILCDQHGGGGAPMSRFFGKETATPTGPAVFAYLTKLPLCFVHIAREAPFCHVMRIIPIDPPHCTTRDEAVEECTLRINAEIEKAVRSYPDQWLWQHRRFREYIK